MAETAYYHDDYGVGPDGRGAPPVQGRLGALANWAGALVSLALLLGMGVWAVQLTLRDVSGVPVIEALEGPMREPPRAPGGVEAPNQGLAVNRIAEGEEAQPVPDRLVLAPPPVELQEVRFETAAPAAPEIAAPGAPGSGAGIASADPSTDGPATGALGASEATADGGAEDPADTRALIERLLREAQPALAAAPLDQSPAPETGVADVLPATVPGVARSLVPARRPADLVLGSGSGSVSAPVQGARQVREIAAADLPDGTRLVQLGAYDSPDMARAEWDRIAERFADYFDDRPRVIEEASSGGQTFFRLRAGGFDDLAGARRFCAVLVAEGAACIPVTVR